MKEKILYLHGFLSSSNTMTANKMKGNYKNLYDFIVPELDGDPYNSLSVINKIIKDEKPNLIIGNSLGGFYALMCESENIPIILINPCINPYKHMERYLDKSLPFHCKRNDGLEEYMLTRDILEHYKDYDVEERAKEKIDKLWVLLSANDEVLGDSHYQFFNRIKQETGYPYDFIKVRNKKGFGHCIYPFGISCLRNMIDEIMCDG